jgi:hypothetical protein
MRRTVGLLIAVALGGFGIISSLARPSPVYAQSSHAYVGEAKCEECHDASHEALTNIIGPAGKPTDPVTVWKADKHSQAFARLVGNDAATAAVAKAHLSGGPQDDGSMCLKCHATGVGGNSPPDPSEGTSCEACHGPAADWVSRDAHGQIGNDPAKMQAAVALGLLDVRKMDIREANCRTCHVKDTSKRPCYVSTEKPFDVHNDQKFRHWRDNIPPI